MEGRRGPESRAEVSRPGLGNALPPFAQPTGGGQSSLPFGQEQGQVNTGAQTFGFAVGASYDDSGGKRGVIGSWVRVACGLVVRLCICGADSCSA